MTTPRQGDGRVGRALSAFALYISPDYRGLVSWTDVCSALPLVLAALDDARPVDETPGVTERLRNAGCNCPKPLKGSRSDGRVRCRLCNAEEPASPSTSGGDPWETLYVFCPLHGPDVPFSNGRCLENDCGIFVSMTKEARTSLRARVQRKEGERIAALEAALRPLAKLQLRDETAEAIEAAIIVSTGNGEFARYLVELCTTGAITARAALATGEGE